MSVTIKERTRQMGEGVMEDYDLGKTSWQR